MCKPEFNLCMSPLTRYASTNTTTKSLAPAGHKTTGVLLQERPFQAKCSLESHIVLVMGDRLIGLQLILQNASVAGASSKDLVKFDKGNPSFNKNLTLDKHILRINWGIEIINHCRHHQKLNLL